eukprot:4152772-Karenia_brevis.AAC.1
MDKLPIDGRLDLSLTDWALEQGKKWVSVSAEKGKRGKEISAMNSQGVRFGNIGIIQDKSDLVLVEAVASDAGDENDEEEYIRVLAVKWRGSERVRDFAEAVQMMSVHEFGDSPLEGELTGQWYLQKLVSTGMTPVARHRAWVSDSNIPSGDRSIHEHHVLMKA